MAVTFKRVPVALLAPVWSYGYAADLKIRPKYPDSKWENKCLLTASRTSKEKAGITKPEKGLGWKGPLKTI